MLFDALLPNNSYYPPVDEARKLFKERTIAYQGKHKTHYYVCFFLVKFRICDILIYEEFHYPNTNKLSLLYCNLYVMIKQLSEVNFETDKPNTYFKGNSEAVHSSKIL